MTIKKTNTRHPYPTHLPMRRMRLWQDESVHQETRIEILPLIDVIFCILTFFILGAVGLSRQQAINLDLPSAKTGKAQMRDMLVVSLDDLGQIYVEQQIVTKTQLSQSIKNYHQSNPEGLMVLHAAKNTTYREVVEVLDVLREVGGDRVALATLPGDSQATETPTNFDTNPNPYLPGLPGLPSNYNPYSIPNPPSPPSN
ncbi:Biopolymer transport protein ExbD/TolR [Stanieria cyanosphaera PCC 7437]|uniref:Biopolymer transport protein ExbD/TolR n=1 Tax=Stanieria cyanosphaera (strain ATCC 29371 / PCC 7437) TaxID=111780 RepID=K9XVC2_STAC7|nr:biopolymer transporter ExbD [Stanieria cyanosphaera]AFZ36550.1 Biopolymer transport protein ExbD/TolR [Stanieria cyanosphaera PCC 7437]